ncbi:uncharacterized protein C8A04DRAFT_31172 [Dichotomopilus funicola]|uniref:Uncharacterized protein n=1 Tax=Dichotomopilus funicola TaxID=1934379 RepID=A0AAN6ZL03_9PEZI|nr:hypothetical protein C8A04DRAFT_31172 [Dichotomopilus funicola]
MSNPSGPSQDLLVRRLLAAFDKPIQNAKTHPDRDKIHKHLKSLCPDPSVPLDKKSDQDNLNKVQILKAWEKDDPKAFNSAIDRLLATYPFPKDGDAEKLDDLARKLYAFQGDYEPLNCSDTIAAAINEIAAKHPEPIGYPDEWAEDNYAGAIAALKRFAAEYKGKETAPPGGDPPGGDPPGGDPPGGPSDDAPEKLWPKFTALVDNGTIKKDSPRWNMTRTTCDLYGCDWADLKFKLEFELRQGTSAGTDTDMHNAASKFLRASPEILKFMEEDFWGDKDMYTIYQAYRDRYPRIVKSRDSRIMGACQSRTPARDQDTIPSRPKKVNVKDGFDKIYVNDPDQGGKRVLGTIVYAWTGWLDVKMPKIEDKDSGEKFSAERDGAPAKWLQKSEKESLEGLELKDVTINHFTYAKAPKQDENKRNRNWPRVFVVGYMNNKPKDERFMTVWVRSTFNGGFRSDNIDAIMIEQRKQDGLPHPGLPRITDIEPEPVSEAESDNSLPF